MQTWIRSAGSSLIASLVTTMGIHAAIGEGREWADGDAPEASTIESISSGFLNLNVAASDVRLVGTRALLRVSEFEQDASDLNDDQDALDQVLMTYDVATNTLVGLGLALDPEEPVLFDGTWAWFFVDEMFQGQTDLNGDSDKDDTVLHVARVATNQVSNLGLAVLPSSLTVTGDKATFVVRESKQGSVDLNGDGDKTDDVWYVFDAATGGLVTFGLAADGTTLAIDGAFAVASISENDQGKLDLNGDGDTSDVVAHVYNAVQNDVHSLGLASNHALIVGSAAILRVPESNNAGLDLNGDGDAADNVLVSVNLTSGLSTSLSLAVVSVPTKLDGWLLAVVSETSQGAGDLNGDGDTNAADRVLHLVDLATGSVINTRLAIGTNVTPLVVTDGQRFAVWVDEAAQGKVDLNADGDTVDLVIEVFDVPTASVVNLGTVGKYLGGEGGRALVTVNELQQGGHDLNGDGDVFDDVLFAFDATTASGTSLGLAADLSLAAGVEGDRAAFAVDESAHGVDANEDGDLADSVLVVQPFGQGSLAGASVAVGGLSFDGNFLVVLVDEEGEDTDLNSDFDRLDQVAHVVFGGIPPTIYCTAKVNSAGCVPAVTTSGTAFLSDDQPLYLFGSNLLPHKFVVFSYGLGGPDAAPFAGGTLCSKAPFGRSPLGVTGGSGGGACWGAIVWNVEAFIESGQDPRLTVGTDVCGQYISRDPLDVAGNYTSLTDAVRFTIAP